MSRFLAWLADKLDNFYYFTHPSRNAFWDNIEPKYRANVKLPEPEPKLDAPAS